MSSPVHKVRTLRRRMEWLESLIAKAPHRNNHHEKAEVSALRWAVPMLEHAAGLTAGSRLSSAVRSIRGEPVGVESAAAEHGHWSIRRTRTGWSAKRNGDGRFGTGDSLLEAMSAANRAEPPVATTVRDPDNGVSENHLDGFPGAATKDL